MKRLVLFTHRPQLCKQLKGSVIAELFLWLVVCLHIIVFDGLGSASRRNKAYKCHWQVWLIQDTAVLCTVKQFWQQGRNVSGKSAVSVNVSCILVCQQQVLILQAAAMDGNNEEALQFEWTSPLGGSPTTYHRVKGVVAEQAMVSRVVRSLLRS